MTTTLIGASDPDDPYGRDRAYNAAMAEQAEANIAAREAERAARVDPATVAALLELIKDKPTIGAYVPKDGDHPLTPYLVDWAEFWTADHDETEWLLEPLFADGRSHALYAGAKTGKSYLILAACAALATGRPFMGHPGGEPQSCLYVDYEMTPADIKERLELFGYGPDDDLTRLHYALLPSLPPLDTEEGGQALVAAARAVRARFVIIDTTSRAIAGDENDADTFRAFYRCTGLGLKQAGIGWMRLDHAGKDASRGQRGSSGKNDDVDVVLRLERTEGGQRLLATHRRMAWYPELTEIAVDEVAGVVTFKMPQGELWPEGTAQLAADLDRIGVPLDAGRPAARAAMKEHGVSGDNKTLSKALKWRRMEALRLADVADQAIADRIRERASTVRGQSTDSDGQPDTGHESPTKLSTDSADDLPRTVETDSDGQPAIYMADSATDSDGQVADAYADSSATVGADSPQRDHLTPSDVPDIGTDWL